jgi:MFS family permease
MAAIVIFELGSLICGVAPTSTGLIIGRAVAGLGTGGIFSGAVVILAYSCKFFFLFSTISALYST